MLLLHCSNYLIVLFLLLLLSAGKNTEITNYKITSGNGSKLLAQLILSSSPRALSAGQVQLSLFFIYFIYVFITYN